MESQSFLNPKVLSEALHVIIIIIIKKKKQVAVKPGGKKTKRCD